MPYNDRVADDEFMQCMEVWGGSKVIAQSVRMGGLDAWVYSKPYGDADRGGDIYYASSCATGRINRLLLADVSGHGDAVAESAKALRTLMRRYVNFLDQRKFVKSLNRQFVSMSRQGRFATAITTTFFSPTRVLTVCNAGHPPPLYYSAKDKHWSIMDIAQSDDDAPRNVPLGILARTDYEQFDVELDVGDLILCYTDALIESHNANGEMLGLKGLRKIVETVSVEPTEAFIQALLDKISGQYSGNLAEDDVTVMLLRPNAKRPQVRLRQKIGAAFRFAGAVFRALIPGAERPPFPDFNLANIVGAVIPPVAKRWRPANPLRTSRPPRQPIP
jgi:phosphoserine phosphatase RsbU/P